MKLVRLLIKLEWGGQNMDRKKGKATEYFILFDPVEWRREWEFNQGEDTYGGCTMSHHLQVALAVVSTPPINDIIEKRS